MKQTNNERALLIGSFSKSTRQRKKETESLEELYLLSKTVQVEIVDQIIQSQDRPHNKTYVGSGKLQEIKQRVKTDHIDTLIFNDNLTPSQAKNIAQVTKCNIVDRTELILDIFALHAQTKEACLQVELAQLEYNYSKLRNMWQHLSRIEGGIGMRGPGETQIEIDRRTIQKRISLLKKKIAEVKKNAVTKRKKRDTQFNVAIVGYTNAGKSTLFNRLTKADVYVADQLFATLDATTRRLFTGENENATITDTIGFIKNLPHTLVTSFYATLLEVVEANLLLHVIDLSNPDFQENIDSVDKVLKEIHADAIDTIMVFNKWDAMEGLERKFLRKQLQLKYPDSVFISARTGENLDTLHAFIRKVMSRFGRLNHISIPEELDKLLAFVMKEGEIVDADFDEEKREYLLDVVMDQQLFKNVKEQVDTYNEIKFIHSIE